MLDTLLCLSEGDEERAHDLKEKYKDVPHIHALHGLVGYGDHDNLDVILENTPIPEDFDILSIDIDGNDYHVWERVEKYRPKLVCIEFNPTVPVGLVFIQDNIPDLNQGCSLAALIELAEKKGYKLVSSLINNAFFVAKKYYDLFNIEDNSEQAIRRDLSHLTYIYCGYDGTIFIAGKNKIPWHGISLSSRIRQLPKFFRQYPVGGSSSLKKWLYSFYRDRI